MVWLKQHSTVERAVIGAVFTAALCTAPAFGQAGGNQAKKFYPDDPLLQDPAPRPVKDVKKRDVDDLYEFLDNSFEVPRREGKLIRSGPHTAKDANTVGDVPDSPWYKNRHYYHRMSIEELKRGPGNSTPPTSRWRVISAKTNGVSPGFVIEDEHKNRYVVKFDPPDYPELASAADVIGSKALYALGYNTPENYVVHFRREDLQIAEGVKFTDATGRKRDLTGRILDEILRPQPKKPDGTYRAMASLYIAGDLVGPFSYEGMRKDDPNDIYPHQDMRELRGLSVFAAWLDHHDTRSINSMDSLVKENGVPYLKHYLLDFGSILGSNGTGPKHPWSGHEYTIDGKGSLIQMVTLGFDMPRWDRADYPNYVGVGRFDSWSFDPLSWKPNYPNAAFLLTDREDAYWAAKQVAAFTDAEIRALVETGEYSDPRATEWIASSLSKRRDKIAEAWFSRVLPLDKFRVVDGKLTYQDPGAGLGIGNRREYALSWASWDSKGRATAITDARGWQVPAFRGDTLYLAATIMPAGGGSAQGNPLIVYLRRGRAGLEVVGVDR
jgi:hypothetical protein